MEQIQYESAFNTTGLGHHFVRPDGTQTSRTPSPGPQQSLANLSPNNNPNAKASPRRPVQNSNSGPNRMQRLKTAMGNGMKKGIGNIKKKWNNSSRLDKALILTSPIPAIFIPLYTGRKASNIVEYEMARKTGKVNIDNKEVVKMVFPKFISSFNPEVPLFLTAMNNFNNHVKMNDKEAVKYAFDKIYDNFIEKGTELEANISHKIRKKLVALKNSDAESIDVDKLKETIEATIEDQTSRMTETLQKLPKTPYLLIKEKRMNNDEFNQLKEWSDPDTLRP